MNKNKNKNKKQFFNRDNITIALMILLLISSVLSVNILVTRTDIETSSLAQKMIRFHVVANSDTAEDQLLKQKVRDEVIDYMEPLIKECESVDETRYILKNSLYNIKKIAEQTIKNYGKSYDIYVVVDKANFPTKSYGDIVLPAGEYEACRIVIGEGKGENWWCVMYPPLCYVDAASGVVPLEGKEQLKKQLNTEQYNLISNHTSGKYQIRFKLIDGINSVLHQSNYKTKR